MSDINRPSDLCNCPIVTYKFLVLLTLSFRRPFAGDSLLSGGLHAPHTATPILIIRTSDVLLRLARYTSHVSSRRCSHSPMYLQPYRLGPHSVFFLSVFLSRTNNNRNAVSTLPSFKNELSMSYSLRNNILDRPHSR